MSKHAYFLLVAVLVVPSLVSATERSIYIGASLGEEVSLAELGGPPTAVDGRSYKLFGGIDINHHFAVELAYHDLGTQFNVATYADWGWGIDIDAYSVNMVARLPVSRFDLFAKFGYLFWDQEVDSITIVGPVSWSEHGRDLMAGAGVDLSLTDHLAVRLEWEYFGLDAERTSFLDDDVDSFSVGVRYVF